MTLRGEHRAFIAAALGLWLLFFVQAINTPVLLDDWFQLRYWRDHELGPGALWAYGRHNYFNYNPRIGEVLLAIVDGSRAVHLIVTPLVQVAVLPIVFAIAFGRWPRRTLRDLQLLLFIQTMIWLVIPIPGVMYFYRPFATNYLWAFTITLALFVPYRLALAADITKPRVWLVPIMLVHGWVAGMCNEHTGPTAMVAMAIVVYAAWRMHRLRAWMVAGMIGLYIGYPMLFFAPGQAVRYGAIATRDTPFKLLADRGITGCLDIVRVFLVDARLAILLFASAVVCYVVRLHALGERFVPPPRRTVRTAAVLAAASASIVFTLFVSPAASDRVFYASGVLLVAAFAIGAQHLFGERGVRRLVVGACIAIFAYHAVRFVTTYAEVKADNEARLTLLGSAVPGSVVVVPRYEHAHRSRWHFGDDFVHHPWVADYVARELFDLSRVDLDRRGRLAGARLTARVIYDPPRAASPLLASPLPTYRQLQTAEGRFVLATQIAAHEDLARFTVRALGVFDDAKRRPVVVIDWTPAGYVFVDGRPHDEPRGHFIRVRAASMPARLESTFVIGCDIVQKVEPVFDPGGADPLVPVDERFCRGPFTAIMCEPDRCWVAGWY